VSSNAERLRAAPRRLPMSPTGPPRGSDDLMICAVSAASGKKPRKNLAPRAARTRDVRMHRGTRAFLLLAPYSRQRGMRLAMRVTAHVRPISRRAFDSTPLSPSTRRRASRPAPIAGSLNHIYVLSPITLLRPIYASITSYSPITDLASATCTAQTSVCIGNTQQASNPCTNQVPPRDATQQDSRVVCDNDQRELAPTCKVCRVWRVGGGS